MFTVLLPQSDFGPSCSCSIPLLLRKEPTLTEHEVVRGHQPDRERERESAQRRSTRHCSQLTSRQICHKNPNIKKDLEHFKVFKATSLPSLSWLPLPRAGQPSSPRGKPGEGPPHQHHLPPSEAPSSSHPPLQKELRIPSGLVRSSVFTGPESSLTASNSSHAV